MELIATIGLGLILGLVGIAMIVGAIYTVAVVLFPDAGAEPAPETQDDFHAAMQRWTRMQKDADR